jgi:hypothetical protein
MVASRGIRKTPHHEHRRTYLDHRQHAQPLRDQPLSKKHLNSRGRGQFYIFLGQLGTACGNSTRESLTVEAQDEPRNLLFDSQEDAD